MPNQVVVDQQASRQNASNTPASVHSWNRRWAEDELQIPVAFRAFHWQPVRSTNRMASIAALRQDTTKASLHTKRQFAGWDDDFLADLISQMRWPCRKGEERRAGDRLDHSETV